MPRLPDYLRKLQQGADPEAPVPPSMDEIPPSGDYKKLQKFLPKQVQDSMPVTDEQDRKVQEMIKANSSNPESFADLMKRVNQQKEMDKNIDQSIKDFGIGQEDESSNNTMLPRLKKMMQSR